MKRFLSALVCSVLGATASLAAVIGVEQPSVKLSDGTVINRAKILDYSSLKGTAIIADEGRILTVPLTKLPDSLRQQLLTEPSREHRPRYNVYRDERAAVPAPQDSVTTPPPPVTLLAPDRPTLTSMEKLILQAQNETADELKFYLIKAFERVTSLTTKIRKAEQIPGWSKIRISGEAAYSVWDNYRRDYAWRTGKFQVEFAVIDGQSLKIDTISFDGISRQVDQDFDR